MSSEEKENLKNLSRSEPDFLELQRGSRLQLEPCEFEAPHKLPDNWHAGISVDYHRYYYFNTVSKVVTWIPPASAWKCAFGLPHGWEIGINDDCHLYFISHVTGTTTFNHPNLEQEQEDSLEQALQSKRRRIAIKRDSQNGFGFVAGSEKPVLIRSIMPGSPSEGLLAANDQIFSINGQVAYNLPQPQVISMIRSCTDTLILDVIASEDVQDVKNQGKLKSALMSRATRERRKSCPVNVRFDDKPEVVDITPFNVLNVNMIKQMLPNVLKVYMENGQTKSFQFTPDTTVADIFDSLVEKLQLKSENLFSLVLIGPYPNQISYLHQEDKVSQVLSRKHFSRWECRLQLCFAPRDAYDLLQEDPFAFDYLYEQIKNSVINGHFGAELKYDVALRLAALQMNEEASRSSGEEERKLHLKEIQKEHGGLDKFLPRGIVYSTRKKDLKKSLNYHLKLCERLTAPGQKYINSLQAKLHYLKIASEASTYGGKGFNAVVVTNGETLPSFKEKQLETSAVALSSSQGICIAVPGSGTVTTQLADFTDINGIVTTTPMSGRDHLKLFLKDRKPISFLMEPQDAEDMMYLVHGYHKIMSDNKSLSLPIINLSQSLPRLQSIDGNAQAPVYSAEHRTVPSTWNYPEHDFNELWNFSTLREGESQVTDFTMPVRFIGTTPEYTDVRAMDNSVQSVPRRRTASDFGLSNTNTDSKRFRISNKFSSLDRGGRKLGMSQTPSRKGLSLIDVTNTENESVVDDEFDEADFSRLSKEPEKEPTTSSFLNREEGIQRFIVDTDEDDIDEPMFRGTRLFSTSSRESHRTSSFHELGNSTDIILTSFLPENNNEETNPVERNDDEGVAKEASTIARSHPITSLKEEEVEARLPMSKLVDDQTREDTTEKDRSQQLGLARTSAVELSDADWTAFNEQEIADMQSTADQSSWVVSFEKQPGRQENTSADVIHDQNEADVDPPIEDPFSRVDPFQNLGNVQQFSVDMKSFDNRGIKTKVWDSASDESQSPQHAPLSTVASTEVEAKMDVVPELESELPALEAADNLLDVYLNVSTEVGAESAGEEDRNPFNDPSGSSLPRGVKASALKAFYEKNTWAGSGDSQASFTPSEKSTDNNDLFGDRISSPVSFGAGKMPTLDEHLIDSAQLKPSDDCDRLGSPDFFILPPPPVDFETERFSPTELIVPPPPDLSEFNLVLVKQEVGETEENEMEDTTTGKFSNLYAVDDLDFRRKRQPPVPPTRKGSLKYDENRHVKELNVESETQHSAPKTNIDETRLIQNGSENKSSQWIEGSSEVKVDVENQDVNDGHLISSHHHSVDETQFFSSTPDMANGDQFVAHEFGLTPTMADIKHSPTHELEEYVLDGKNLDLEFEDEHFYGEDEKQSSVYHSDFGMPGLPLNNQVAGGETESNFISRYEEHDTENTVHLSVNRAAVVNRDHLIFEEDESIVDTVCQVNVLSQNIDSQLDDEGKFNAHTHMINEMTPFRGGHRDDLNLPRDSLKLEITKGKSPSHDDVDQTKGEQKLEAINTDTGASYTIYDAGKTESMLDDLTETMVDSEPCDSGKDNVNSGVILDDYTNETKVHDTVAVTMTEKTPAFDETESGDLPKPGATRPRYNSRQSRLKFQFLHGGHSVSDEEVNISDDHQRRSSSSTKISDIPSANDLHQAQIDSEQPAGFGDNSVKKPTGSVTLSEINNNMESDIDAIAKNGSSSVGANSALTPRETEVLAQSFTVELDERTSNTNDRLTELDIRKRSFDEALQNFKKNQNSVPAYSLSSTEFLSDMKDDTLQAAGIAADFREGNKVSDIDIKTAGFGRNSTVDEIIVPNSKIPITILTPSEQEKQTVHIVLSNGSSSTDHEVQDILGDIQGVSPVDISAIDDSEATFFFGPDETSPAITKIEGKTSSEIDSSFDQSPDGFIDRPSGGVIDGPCVGAIDGSSDGLMYGPPNDSLGRLPYASLDRSVDGLQYHLPDVPCTASDVPCTVSDAPCTVSDAPCTVSVAPCTVSDTPCTVSDTPCTVSDAPCTVSVAPCTVSDAPCTVSDTPCTVSDTPCTVSGASCTVSDTSCTVSDTPCTVSDAPCTVSDVPSTLAVDDSVCRVFDKHGKPAKEASLPLQREIYFDDVRDNLSMYGSDSGHELFDSSKRDAYDLHLNGDQPVVNSDIKISKPNIVPSAGNPTFQNSVLSYDNDAVPLGVDVDDVSLDSCSLEDVSSSIDLNISGINKDVSGDISRDAMDSLGDEVMLLSPRSVQSGASLTAEGPPSIDDTKKQRIDIDMDPGDIFYRQTEIHTTSFPEREVVKNGTASVELDTSSSFDLSFPYEALHEKEDIRDSHVESENVRGEVAPYDNMLQGISRKDFVQPNSCIKEPSDPVPFRNSSPFFGADENPYQAELLTKHLLPLATNKREIVKDVNLPKQEFDSIRDRELISSRAVLEDVRSNVEELRDSLTDGTRPFTRQRSVSTSSDGVRAEISAESGEVTVLVDRRLVDVDSRIESPSTLHEPKHEESQSPRTMSPELKNHPMARGPFYKNENLSSEPKYHPLGAIPFKGSLGRTSGKLASRLFKPVSLTKDVTQKANGLSPQNATEMESKHLNSNVNAEVSSIEIKRHPAQKHSEALTDVNSKEATEANRRFEQQSPMPSSHEKQTLAAEEEKELKQPAYGGQKSPRSPVIGVTRKLSPTSLMDTRIGSFRSFFFEGKEDTSEGTRHSRSSSLPINGPIPFRARTTPGRIDFKPHGPSRPKTQIVTSEVSTKTTNLRLPVTPERKKSADNEMNTGRVPTPPSPMQYTAGSSQKNLLGTVEERTVGHVNLPKPSVYMRQHHSEHRGHHRPVTEPPFHTNEDQPVHKSKSEERPHFDTQSNTKYYSHRNRQNHPGRISPSITKEGRVSPKTTDYRTMNGVDERLPTESSVIPIGMKTNEALSDQRSPDLGGRVISVVSSVNTREFKDNENDQERKSPSLSVDREDTHSRVNDTSKSMSRVTGRLAKVSIMSSFVDSKSSNIVNVCQETRKRAVTLKLQLQEAMTSSQDDNIRHVDKVSLLDSMRAWARSLSKSTRNIVSVTTGGNQDEMTNLIHSSLDRLNNLVITTTMFYKSSIIEEGSGNHGHVDASPTNLRGLINSVLEVVDEYGSVLESVESSIGKSIGNVNVVRLIEQVDQLGFALSVVIRAIRSITSCL